MRKLLMVYVLFNIIISFITAIDLKNYCSFETFFAVVFSFEVYCNNNSNNNNNAFYVD